MHCSASHIVLIMVPLLRAVFSHLVSRKVEIAGITVHPDERWTRQMARNVTMEEDAAPFGTVAIPRMIATPSTPILPSDHRVRSNRSRCLAAGRQSHSSDESAA